MATHSSILAWRIPGMGEHGGLPSMGSHRVGHDRSNLAAAAACLYYEKETKKSIVKAQRFQNCMWGKKCVCVKKSYIYREKS